MKQTGLLPSYPRPEDHYMGGITGIPEEVRIENGDWTPYKPSDEKQYEDMQFDTMSCTSFAMLNTIEAQINYLFQKNLLNPTTIAFLKGNGYLKDGTINFSDRFTAIVSNTTKTGNSFQNVGDAIREYGLLPEDDLPFGGRNWEEYHDKKLITPEMYKKAKQIKFYFQLNYEWVLFNYDGIVDAMENGKLINGLKQAPLELGIPMPATHATVLISQTKMFDTYPPYIFDFTENARPHYAFKMFVTEKAQRVSYQFTKNLTVGSIGNDVLMLQKFLNTTNTPVIVDGKPNTGKETTYFGFATRDALAAFQRENGITPALGYFGPITRGIVNEMCKTSLLDLWALAIQQHEGYFPPSQVYPRGSRSWRNNNAGNLKFHPIQKRAVGKDDAGFAIFKTYADGFTELKEMLTRCATGQSPMYKPTMSLYDFFAVYAPDADNNDSKAYAEAVARRIGVQPTVQISTLV